MTKEELSEMLINYRINNNLTQKEMADKFKVSIYTYREWERGYCVPKNVNLQNIYKVIKNA